MSALCQKQTLLCIRAQAKFHIGYSFNRFAGPPLAKEAVRSSIAGETKVFVALGPAPILVALNNHRANATIRAVCYDENPPCYQPGHKVCRVIGLARGYRSMDDGNSA
jgi:hypothetical protein